MAPTLLWGQGRIGKRADSWFLSLRKRFYSYFVYLLAEKMAVWARNEYRNLFFAHCKGHLWFWFGTYFTMGTDSDQKTRGLLVSVTFNEVAGKNQNFFCEKWRFGLYLGKKVSFTVTEPTKQGVFRSEFKPRVK